MPEENNEAYSLGSPATSQFTRRKFFFSIGMGSALLALGGCSTGIVTLLTPKMNYEPSTSFTIGRPTDYQKGDMKLLEAKQVFIFRSYWKDEKTGQDVEGFQALTDLCTHLGCSYKPFDQHDHEAHATGYLIKKDHAHCH